MTGAVLVGGASTRMGRDKSHLRVGGETTSVEIAALLGRFCAEVLLVGGSPPEAAIGRRVADPAGPHCALRGLVAALAAAYTRRVFVVATDLVGLRAELLLGLLARGEADVVMPIDAEGPQPLCAVYAREKVLVTARGQLAEGRLALRELTSRLEAVGLSGADLAALSSGGAPYVNVNTPEDLAAAEALLSRRPPAS